MVRLLLGVYACGCLVFFLFLCAFTFTSPLILFHFSARHSGEEIVEAIAREARALDLRFPIHAILPGEIARDLLAERPVWAGKSR